MSLRNCSKCGKLFGVLTSTEICPECQDAEEQEFESVRNYILKHAGVSVEEVARETGVRVEKILGYLRDGRLMSGASVSFSEAYKLTCYSCGTPIAGGRLCQRCAEQFSQNVRSSIEQRKSDTSRAKSEGSKMRSR